MQGNIMVIGDMASGQTLFDCIARAGFEIVNRMGLAEGLQHTTAEGCKLIIIRDTDEIIEHKEQLVTFKTNARFKWIPILILSSNQDLDRRMTYLEIGIDDVITMPISKRELITRVTKWYQKSSDIEDAAFKDKLTKAYNRSYFDNQVKIELARSVREGKPLSLAFIDLDKFKSVNDTYGHDVGDEVLIRVCKFLLANTRITDVVARFGGEEFIILFNGLSGEEAANKVQELLEKCRENVITLPCGTPLHVTFSSGVAQWNEGISIDQWIKTADEGVYEAKRQGRNRVVFNYIKTVDGDKAGSDRKLNMVYVGQEGQWQELVDLDNDSLIEVTFYKKIDEIPMDTILDVLCWEAGNGIDYSYFEEMQEHSSQPFRTIMIGMNMKRYDIARSLVNGIDFFLKHPVNKEDFQRIIKKIRS